MHFSTLGRAAWPSATIAFALTATLALSACGTTASSGDSSGMHPSGASGKTIIYIWPDKEPFYAAVGCGAQDVGAKAGVRFSFSEPPRTFSPSDQIPILNGVIAKHPDAIMISASDPKALIVPLKQASAQGIKVVTVANNIDDTSFLTSAVVADNKAIGSKSADLLADKLAGKSGDVGMIAYQRGGSTITDARQDGFEAEIRKYPNLHYVGAAVSTTNSGSGAAATNALISGHPKLLGLVNLFNANETATALRERHLDGKVVAIGLGVDQSWVHDVTNGSLSALVVEPIRQEGRDAMTQLVNVFDGKPVTKAISEAPVELTKGNINDPSMAQYVPGPNC